MGKKDARFSVVVGLISLSILLSNFRDILNSISVDIGYINFTLEDYYLVVVVAIAAALYLLAIDYLISKTKFGTRKAFNLVGITSNVILAAILLSPMVIGISYLVNLLVIKMSEVSAEANEVFEWVNLSLSVVVTVMSAIYTTLRYRSLKLDEKIRKLGKEEVEEIHKANDLLRSKFYSQSILESFKVLEIHVYRLLSKMEVRVRRSNIHEMLDIAVKNEVLNEEDLVSIEKIRKMRNESAHLDIEHTEEQAKFALNFVKSVLQRNYS